MKPDDRLRLEFAILAVLSWLALAASFAAWWRMLREWF
jgi:hypothetical protein